MKHIISILSVICLLFSLSACAENVNMQGLAAYQSGDFSAEAIIILGGESYKTEIEKRGEKLAFRFREPQKLAAFSFIFTEDGASLATGGTEIPICENSFFKFSALRALFCVPTDGAWKIQRESPGGVDVYVCKNGGTVLYIDANSHTPLKIYVQGVTADILRFTK